VVGGGQLARKLLEVFIPREIDVGVLVRSEAAAPTAR